MGLLGLRFAAVWLDADELFSESHASSDQLVCKLGELVTRKPLRPALLHDAEPRTQLMVLGDEERHALLARAASALGPRLLFELKIRKIVAKASSLLKKRSHPCRRQLAHWHDGWCIHA